MKLRPLKDRVLVKKISFNPSKYIHLLSDNKGTFNKSLLPGSQDLEEIDAGLVRGNVGQVVECSDEVSKKDLFKSGDYILYRKGSAVSNMGYTDSVALADMYGEEVSGDNKTLYYIIPLDEIVAVLPDGDPGDGRFW